MECALDQIKQTDYRKYYQALQDGNIGSLPDLLEPANFYLPAYGIEPGFRTTMDEWARVPLDANDELM